MIARTYLRNFYLNKKLSQGIHLEGGAALSFYYLIKRPFSGDLDFTISTKEKIKSFRANMIKSLPGSSYKHINSSRTQLYNKNRKPILSIDYFLEVHGTNSFKIMFLDGITSKIHSLEDILAEKFFCMIKRDFQRDVRDAAKIIRRYEPSYKVVNVIFKKKQKVKKTKSKDLSEFLMEIEKLVTQKKDWKYQAKNISYIKTFLSS